MLVPSNPQFTPLTVINDKFLNSAQISIFIKRDELIHPEISGNKWRKLKYNIQNTIKKNQNTILTFGGAYSNHLFATATACSEAGISSIGIVRGEELNVNSSDTLRHCHKKGMQLIFVSRSEYRLKSNGPIVKSILNSDRDIHVIPEGGANVEGMQGMAELPKEINAQLGYSPDYIAVAAGTGSSAAGLLYGGAKVVAFSVLKGGDFLKQDISQMIGDSFMEQDLDLQTSYHFGGYGKYTQELLDFIIWFEETHHITIEQVYTGKMLFGLYDLIKKKYFPKGSTLVALHTGGLQGRLNTLAHTTFQTDFQ